MTDVLTDRAAENAVVEILASLRALPPRLRLDAFAVAIRAALDAGILEVPDA